MKLLFLIKMPAKKYNSVARDGTAAKTIDRILEEAKPETVYALLAEGQRAIAMVVNVKEESDIPALAEPWLLSFNAEVRVHPVLSHEGLKKSGLDSLAKKWS